jgi:hypothetical protein
MSYDNLSSVSQNVLKFYQQLTGEERRIPFIFDDFHFCRSRVIGLVYFRYWSILAPFRLGKSFSPGPPVSYTNKTDRHDITETLLKVALNIIKQTNKQTLYLETINISTI